MALLCAAGLFPAAAAADYALLRSGARLHITGYERDGERVRLTVDGGRSEERRVGKECVP